MIPSTPTRQPDATAQPDPRTPLLRMLDISKSFPGVKALDRASLDLVPGEIHALVGENGAGKSTLMKVLSGVYPYPQYSGEIRIEGELRQFRHVRDAALDGVAIVHQELSLVPEMTVAENIFLGREPRHFGVVLWEELYSKAERLLHELQLEIEPATKTVQLSLGEQQQVEIAKALSHRARILILDEPTTALTDTEAAALFQILRKLRIRGIGIVYISHRLGEVFSISDRITVMRDGQTLGSFTTRDLDERRVIAMMVGRPLTQLFPVGVRSPGEIAFEVRRISTIGATLTGKVRVSDVSFSVRRGEILGIGGLMGSGRSELLMALFGACVGHVSGEVLIEGKPIRIKGPADAIAHGMGFVTEDRHRSGLLSGQSVLHNMTLASLPRLSARGVTDESREIAAGLQMMQELQIKACSLFSDVGTLSGGTQQKIVLAKWLLTQTPVLFLDEPTRGIDVSTKHEFYTRMDLLARQGLAIVLVSSDLEELLGLADRILVLHQGRVTGEFSRQSATQERIMACATGHPEFM